MPQRPVPDNEKHRRGTYRADRARTCDTKSTGPIGAPPGHLSPDAAACWLELASIAPTGTLTRQDRVHLELASNLLADMRAGNSKISAYRMLDGLLCRMGLNPQTRGTIPTATDHDDPLDLDDDDVQEHRERLADQRAIEGLFDR